MASSRLDFVPVSSWFFPISTSVAVLSYNGAALWSKKGHNWHMSWGLKQRNSCEKLARISENFSVLHLPFSMRLEECVCICTLFMSRIWVSYRLTLSLTAFPTSLVNTYPQSCVGLQNWNTQDVLWPIHSPGRISEPVWSSSSFLLALGLLAWLDSFSSTSESVWVFLAVLLL